MFGLKKLFTDFCDDLFRDDSISDNSTKQLVTVGVSLTAILTIKKV